MFKSSENLKAKRRGFRTIYLKVSDSSQSFDMDLITSISSLKREL